MLNRPRITHVILGRLCVKAATGECGPRNFRDIACQRLRPENLVSWGFGVSARCRRIREA